MPIKNYQLLVGKALEMTLDDDDSPHIEIKIQTDDQKLHRIAVNVRSILAPHALLYRKIEGYTHPITENLVDYTRGQYDLTAAEHNHLVLDYVRGDLFDRETLQIAPFSQEGPNNDLKEFILPLINTAIAEDDALVYAFGETWGPEEDRPDSYFGFTPGRGIHDIHMNQGSDGRFRETNGINQDGALFLRFPNSEAEWTAIFLAFQTQSWDTNAETGHPLSAPTPSHPSSPQPAFDPMVRIVAALVNASNPEEGKETITLFNRSDAAIDLSRWSLEDRDGRIETLRGHAIAAGEAYRLTLSGQGARLGNSGGSISLKDSDNREAHSVNYQRSDVPAENWSLLF